MIGSLEDATAALEGDLPVLSRNGGTRLVYRLGDVVYKVARFDSEDNVREWIAVQRYRSEGVPSPFAVPDATLWNVDGEEVIAMTFIDGAALAQCCCLDFEEHLDCLPDDIEELAHDLIGDTGGANVVFDGSLYWLIDFGG